jgi:hypothetical protein
LPDRIVESAAGHDLHGLPHDLGTFVEFCDTRRERMKRRLTQTSTSPSAAEGCRGWRC